MNMMEKIDPVGHFDESGKFVDGLKKPRNVLIEKNGEISPIFGDDSPEQRVEELTGSIETAEQIANSPENSSGLKEEDRQVFEKLSRQEDDLGKLLKTKKELGIHTQEDELKLEEAAAKVNEFMNARTK